MSTTLDFPILSKGPAQNGYQEVPVDNVISDDASTGGYKFSRPLSTRMIWQFVLKYEMMPDVDAIALRDFIRNYTQGSGVSFNWTNPITQETKECRFSKTVPTITFAGFGSSNEQASQGYLWNLDYTIEEV